MSLTKTIEAILKVYKTMSMLILNWKIISLLSTIHVRLTL